MAQRSAGTARRQPIGAAADFLALADSFPASERSATALYLLGLGAYQNGLPSQTVELYARLQRDFPEYKTQAVGYWLGRAYHAQGDVEQAHNQWRTLMEQAPDIYYGVLAALSLRQPLLEQGQFLAEIAAIAPAASRLADDDGSQQFAERWLANWLGIEPDLLATLPAAVAADQELANGWLLLELGQRGDGLPYLERVYQRYQGDAHALYALSLAFERLGVYRLSLLSMARLLELSPAWLVEDAPIFLQKKLYPQPFAELIVPEAQAQGLDPLLLFSLIRQESLFEEGARSYAAAQGLAQIIPATGQWVADQLGYPGYSNALIYRPNINVKFGAYYLNWARGYLDGNLVSALVGYNAGPGNSEYWRGLSGADDPLFVEILDVTEPRIYVQMITSNLYHYNRLYGGS
ncbi:MAG: lytic transglycosylase domain-containing protein [Caldilineaceae bacterium]|nr:lytic transglycosylase domain-containing protein [Caldilineaceae bacterium]